MGSSFHGFAYLADFGMVASPTKLIRQVIMRRLTNSPMMPYTREVGPAMHDLIFVKVKSTTIDCRILILAKMPWQFILSLSLRSIKGFN